MTTRPTAQTTTSTGAWPASALFPQPSFVLFIKRKKIPFSAPSAKCPRRCVKAHDQTSERTDYNPTQRKGSNEEQPPPTLPAVSSPVFPAPAALLTWPRWKCHMAGEDGEDRPQAPAWRGRHWSECPNRVKIILTEMIWLKCFASETIKEEKSRSAHGRDYLSTKITN